METGPPETRTARAATGRAAEHRQWPRTRSTTPPAHSPIRRRGAGSDIARGSVVCAFDEERSDGQRIGAAFAMHANGVVRRTDERLAVNVEARIQQRTYADTTADLAQQRR